MDIIIQGSKHVIRRIESSLDALSEPLFSAGEKNEWYGISCIPVVHKYGQRIPRHWF